MSVMWSGREDSGILGVMFQWAKQTKKRGFTIVELLIVIVVIAILAAVTVVGYSGIQSQAKNTTFLAAMDAYEKAMRLYYAAYGTFPSTRLDSGVYEQTCLGEDFVATAGFSEGKCFSDAMIDSYTGTNKDTVGIVIPSVNEALKEFVQPLPEAAEREFSIGDMPYSRGIGYQGGQLGSQHFATLYYYTDGDQKCGRGNRSVATLGGKEFTTCNVVLSHITN